MKPMSMRARGFSLVEFMIAVTLGLFMVAGLVYLIAETSRSRAEIERSSRQIENGRYAIDRIAEDLRHAGFFGDPADDFKSALAATPPAALADPCATAFAVSSDDALAFPVQAYDGGNTLPVPLQPCLSGLNWKPQTDILVVRRASTSTPLTKAQAAAGANANMLFIQTGRGAGDWMTHAIARGSNGAALSLTRLIDYADPPATGDAPVRRFIVRIYFVSTTDDTGAAMPTLKMIELVTGPAFSAPVSIAEGIEELRFDFGLDTTGTKDGVADNCGATGLVRFTQCNGAVLATAADEVNYFANVVAMQVYLVARNAETSPDYADDKTYSLGLKGYTTATGDGYRRHAYTTFVRLNNVSMPRE